MFKGKFRYKILLWLFFVMLIAYFDRVNFGMAVPSIMKEFQLTGGQIGMIMSGFYIGYTIFNYLAGYITDRLGVSLTIVLLLLLWSASTIGTGLAVGFTSLMIVRILFGAFEGPLPASVNGIVSKWMLPREKAMSSAVWLSAVPVGVVIGNVISGYIITAWGWPAVFYIFGAAGIIIALISWKVLKDYPADHPSVTKEEKDLIESSYTTHAIQTGASTYGQLLRNPSVWMLAITFFALATVYWANLNWLPTYFIKARGSNLIKSGFYSSAPWAASFVGLFVMGWLSDHVGKGFRSNWIAAAFFIAAPVIVLAVKTPSLELCIAFFCVALFLNMGAMGLMYAVQSNLYSKEDIAKVAGIVVAAGSVAGILSPYLVGIILDYTGSFNMAYYIFAGTSVVAGIFGLLLLQREKAIYLLKEKKV
jgi:MFS transporter, ACS family, hexuronate transporter